MADPYEVLGLAPNATIDAAEEAYHHRLLRCHPDLHAAEGPEAVARAEEQTRVLNDAIHEIRHGYRPTPRSTGRSSRSSSTSSSGRASGRAGTREQPWPGTADRRRSHAPVPCPFCGDLMSSLSGFEDHLARAHQAQYRTTRKANRRHARAQRWWWPVPLWLFALIDAALVGLSIAVVAAMGGHATVVENVLGDDAPRQCVRGELVRARLGGFHRCNPDEWPISYIVVGVLLFGTFAAYRWTTKRRPVVVPEHPDRQEPADEVDWFGNPLGPRDGGPRPPVPCPLCGAPFTDQPQLAEHAKAEHDVRLAPIRPSRFERLPGWARTLGYLPLWYVLPLSVGLMALVYLLVRPIDPWIAVYAAVLASLPLVLVLSHRVFNPPDR